MVSIIVTVYNTPVPDLLRCIQSIRNQNYEDFEVIIIDDGSRTDIAEAVDESALSDPRFRVYHMKNGGVSHARNEGIRYAKGSYISFCDSDDELLPNFLKHGMAQMISNNLDIIVGG